MKNIILKMWVPLQRFGGGLRRNTTAQDLVEYALMAGFVAVAAGAIMPNVASSISTIFSKLASALSTSASGMF